jgi:hypothetical protein
LKEKKSNIFSQKMIVLASDAADEARSHFLPVNDFLMRASSEFGTYLKSSNKSGPCYAPVRYSFNSVMHVHTPYKTM